MATKFDNSPPPTTVETGGAKERKLTSGPKYPSRSGQLNEKTIAEFNRDLINASADGLPSQEQIARLKSRTSQIVIDHGKIEFGSSKAAALDRLDLEGALSRQLAARYQEDPGSFKKDLANHATALSMAPGPLGAFGTVAEDSLRDGIGTNTWGMAAFGLLGGGLISRAGGRLLKWWRGADKVQDAGKLAGAAAKAANVVVDVGAISSRWAETALKRGYFMTQESARAGVELTKPFDVLLVRSTGEEIKLLNGVAIQADRALSSDPWKGPLALLNSLENSGEKNAKIVFRHQQGQLSAVVPTRQDINYADVEQDFSAITAFFNR